MQCANVFNNNRFLKSNRFNVNSIIGKKLFDDTKEKIEIDKALISVHLPSYNFSNYFRSKKDIMFKFVKREYMMMNNDKYNILDHFELKNVDFGGNLSRDKMDQIIEKTFGSKIHIYSIYRFKNLLNPAFQLYVNKDNNNDFKVVVIDLYHLMIPAADRFRGKKIADLISDYEAVKDYSVCLSNIKG